MKYRVIVRPEAEDDLKEAYSWYEDKRALDLGSKLNYTLYAGSK